MNENTGVTWLPKIDRYAVNIRLQRYVYAWRAAAKALNLKNITGKLQLSADVISTKPASSLHRKSRDFKQKAAVEDMENFYGGAELKNIKFR